MSTPELQFVELVRNWLVSLPHDLKIAFDAMDDENLNRTDRELAVGAIMYVVSPNDFIKDRNEAVASFADDAVLLRLAFRRLARSKDEDTAAFCDRFPELFEGLDEQLESVSSQMGDLMTWLEGKVDNLGTSTFKGKKPATYLDDDEAREDLFELGLAFRTNYPIDEKIIGDRLKKASTVVEVMKKRRAEETRLAGG